MSLKTLKITAILVVFSYLSAYAQTKIEAAVIGNDTVFVMNRAYAELVANRFDSLASLKLSFKQCESVVDGLQFSIMDRSELIRAQSGLIENLRLDISVQNEIVQSYKRTEAITTDIQKQLRAETRKRKTWTVLCIGALVGGVASAVYFGFR
jgi:hypothetical protein